MKRRIGLLGAIVCVLLLTGPAVDRAVAATDIPGVPLPVSPVQGYLNWQSHINDVYSIQMTKDDQLNLTLNADGTTNGYFAIFLYQPGLLSISNANSIAQTWGFTYPKVVTYSATESGTYYVNVCVWSPSSSNKAYGNYAVTYTCQSPTICAWTTRSKTIRAGTSTTISGKLKMAYGSAPVAARTVRLQRSTGKRWQSLTSCVTGESGTFSVKVRPSVTTRYRAIFAGSTSYLTSKTTTLTVRLRP